MSDYLWDKSGEADPEVEQLEDLFEGLRFQPREFQLPELPRSEARSKGARWPRLAAAAALVLMGLAGLWLVRHRQAGQSLTPPAIAQAPGAGEAAVAVNEKPETGRLQSGSYAYSKGTLLMDSKRHERKLNQAQMQRTGRASFRKERSAPAGAEATAPEQRQEVADVGPRRQAEQQEEQAEGVRAKEELMLALQVASSKLNHAQRKARGIAPSAAPADKPGGLAPNLME